MEKEAKAQEREQQKENGASFISFIAEKQKDNQTETMALPSGNNRSYIPKSKQGTPKQPVLLGKSTRR